MLNGSLYSGDTLDILIQEVRHFLLAAPLYPRSSLTLCILYSTPPLALELEKLNIRIPGSYTGREVGWRLP